MEGQDLGVQTEQWGRGGSQDCKWLFHDLSFRLVTDC